MFTPTYLEVYIQYKKKDSLDVFAILFWNVLLTIFKIIYIFMQKTQTLGVQQSS